MEKKAWQKRGFVSLLTFTSFIVMTVTGLILYITPQGRIAYWVVWHLIGLTKTQWGNIHTLSSVLFIVSGIFHVVYNWKPFVNYILDKINGGLKLKREMAVTSAITLVLMVSAIASLPPLIYIVDLSDTIKDAWIISKDYEPPYGHAEETALKVFVKKMNIDLDAALEEFRANGVVIENAMDSLDKIAAANDTSPMGLYMIIKKLEPKPETGIVYTPELVEEKFTGTGLGQRTLDVLLEKVGAEKRIAEARLRKNGIIIKKDEKMRQAAERYGINPIDILKVILVEDYTIEK